MRLHIHRGRRSLIYPYIYQQCRCGAKRTGNPQYRREMVLADWPTPVDAHGRPLRRTGWVRPATEEG